MCPEVVGLVLRIPMPVSLLQRKQLGRKLREAPCQMPLAAATGSGQRLLIALGSAPDFSSTLLPEAVAKPVVVTPGGVMSDTERR